MVVPRDLTTLYYRAEHWHHDWATVVLSVNPAVMARARTGDKGARDNLCIAFRKQLLAETGRRLERVEWCELAFELL